MAVGYSATSPRPTAAVGAARPGRRLSPTPPGCDHPTAGAPRSSSAMLRRCQLNRPSTSHASVSRVGRSASAERAAVASSRSPVPTPPRRQDEAALNVVRPPRRPMSLGARPRSSSASRNHVHATAAVAESTSTAPLATAAYDEVSPDRQRQQALEFQAMVNQARTRFCKEESTVPSRIALISDESESPPSSLQGKPVHVPAIAGRAALWISIDPPTGTLKLYPRAAAARLETAHGCNRSNVPLGGLSLGRHLEDAVIYLEGDSQQYASCGQPVQRTLRGGVRDVRRLELDTDQEGLPHVDVVLTESGWRICEFSSNGLTEERFVPPDWVADAVPAFDKFRRCLPPLPGSSHHRFRLASQAA